jgi:DNA-binding NarL/FixJ family response regulator
VLTLLLNSFDRPMIAQELGLSEYTVADYTKQIYRHFDVRSQLELIRLFFHNELGT